jgi:hypothetical protein
VVAPDPEEAVEVDGEAPGSGEPRRTASRRTQARARRRESARRTHHGRCCHRRLNDGRRWSRNGRRLIGSRGGTGPARARARAHDAALAGREARRVGIWDAPTAACERARERASCSALLLDFFPRWPPAAFRSRRGAAGSVVPCGRALVTDVRGGCLA